MKTSNWIRILSGALALAAGGAGLRAQEIDAEISSDFVGIAGSEDQARALVVGLRNGTAVSLSSSDGQTITITPVGGPLGWGNAYIVLSLAQEELAEFGITDPTPVQLAVVLVGGDLVVNGVSRHVDGILRLYVSDGNDWDRVSRRIGVSFDPVREHWRRHEARFDRSGGSARFEDNDRPRGEAGWERQQQNPQTIDRGSQIQEDRSQDVQSRQDTQRQEQPNANRARTNAAPEQQYRQQGDASQQRDQQSRQNEPARGGDQQKPNQSLQLGNGTQQAQPREEQSRGEQNQLLGRPKKDQVKDQKKADQDSKEKPDQQQGDKDHPHD